MKTKTTAQKSGNSLAIRVAWPIFLLLGSISGPACGGLSHAEYAPSNHPWIGKCAMFSLPMAYVTNLSADFGGDG